MCTDVRSPNTFHKPEDVGTALEMSLSNMGLDYGNPALGTSRDPIADMQILLGSRPIPDA